MANPPHLLRADGRLDELVLHMWPWSVGVVDETGSDPPSSYIEDLSLGIPDPPCLHAVGQKELSA